MQRYTDEAAPEIEMVAVVPSNDMEVSSATMSLGVFKRILTGSPFHTGSSPMKEAACSGQTLTLAVG